MHLPMPGGLTMYLRFPRKEKTKIKLKKTKNLGAHFEIEQEKQGDFSRLDAYINKRHHLQVASYLCKAFTITTAIYYGSIVHQEKVSAFAKMCQVTAVQRCQSKRLPKCGKLAPYSCARKPLQVQVRSQSRHHEEVRGGWKLLANVYLGSQKYLFVKRFSFLADLKHEIYLLVQHKHYQYEKIADKLWILGPDDETSASYTYTDGALHLDASDEEEDQYDSW